MYAFIFLATVIVYGGSWLAARQFTRRRWVLFVISALVTSIVSKAVIVPLAVNMALDAIH